jgi:hypothetical protein
LAWDVLRGYGLPLQPGVRAQGGATCLGTQISDCGILGIFKAPWEASASASGLRIAEPGFGGRRVALNLKSQKREFLEGLTCMSLRRGQRTLARQPTWNLTHAMCFQVEIWGEGKRKGLR